MRVVLPLLFAVLLSTSLTADTQTGTANRNRSVNYAFTPSANGEAHITISWTRSNVDVLAILVCGQGADIVTFGVAAGRLDRVATITAGLVQGVPCLLGISTLNGSTPFRAHISHAQSQRTSNAGTSPLALREVTDNSSLVAAAERELITLRRLGR